MMRTVTLTYLLNSRRILANTYTHAYTHTHVHAARARTHTHRDAQRQTALAAAATGVVCVFRSGYVTINQFRSFLTTSFPFSLCLGGLLFIKMSYRIICPKHNIAIDQTFIAIPNRDRIIAQPYWQCKFQNKGTTAVCIYVNLC